MKIKREVLLKKLEAVSAGLAKKALIDQSQCFVFKDGHVHTFNDEIACFVEVKLEVEGAVSAEPVLNLLRRLKEDEMDVSQDRGELKIKGKGRRAGISMEDEVLLSIEGLEKPGKWKKLPKDFVEAARIVGVCAGTDESQFASTCVHIHPKWIEASDNEQIIRYPIKTGVKKSILVRWTSLKNIVGLGMTKVSLTEDWIHFLNDDGLVLSCRRNEANYPDLKPYLGISGSKVTLPKGLGEAVEKAEVFCGDEIGDSVVKVCLADGKLLLEGRGTTGWYQEKKKVDYDGDPLEFLVAPSLLVELSKHSHECFICDGGMKVETDKFTYVSCIYKEEESK